jgi:ubiquitin-conjugating enzyme E2 D/E
MSMALKRIKKELSDMKESKNCDISENVSAGPVSDNNLLCWNATLIGAVDTPYEGGIFKLSVNFPNNYPFVPPIIKFITKIFHPNIHENGDICLDILKYHWSPAYSVSQVLLSILSLLSDPNPDDPLNSEASHLYKSNRIMYNQRVRDYIDMYTN